MSPLSKNVVIVLETQKLPIKGLDSIQTLGLAQLQTLPNWGVCRERWEGAVRMEKIHNPQSGDLVSRPGFVSWDPPLIMMMMTNIS